MEAARGGQIVKDYEKSYIHIHAVGRNETKTPRPPQDTTQQLILIGYNSYSKRENKKYDEP